MKSLVCLVVIILILSKCSDDRNLGIIDKHDEVEVENIVEKVPAFFGKRSLYGFGLGMTSNQYQHNLDSLLNSGVGKIRIEEKTGILIYTLYEMNVGSLNAKLNPFFYSDTLRYFEIEIINSNCSKAHNQLIDQKRSIYKSIEPELNWFQCVPKEIIRKIETKYAANYDKVRRINKPFMSYLQEIHGLSVAGSNHKVFSDDGILIVLKDDLKLDLEKKIVKVSNSNIELKSIRDIKGDQYFIPSYSNNSTLKFGNFSATYLDYDFFFKKFNNRQPIKFLDKENVGEI